MIYYTSYNIFFTIHKARDGTNCSPGWFLDENDVEVRFDFENGFDD